jgi:adenylate cyclase
MSVDESATVEALQGARQEFVDHTTRYGGRVVDTAGDSVLAVFPTASGAMSASVAIQDVLCARAQSLPSDRQLLFRIGVHLSEILEGPDGTVYGDGINIAARIQSVSEPGSIVVSEAIRAAVKGKQGISFIDLGTRDLKNIAESVRIFQIRSKNASDDDSGPPKVAGVSAAPERLALPDKPSIAVLPFTNMSADAEQEYFCDGISDDLITELSRFHSLFVIARNSTFTYKGRSVDVRTVAAELGVRYVLEGSVRRSANRIRITAQLLDAMTGTQLWAEKFDRDATEIFEVQEELTRRMVVSIAPFIDEAEREKVRRRPDSFGAYEIGVRANLKGHEAYQRFDAIKINEAISDARAALAIDPRSVIALVALALCQWQHIMLGSAPDRNSAWQEGMDAANRAIEADRNDCMGYVCKSLLFAFAPPLDRANEALSVARRAVELNPHSTASLGTLAFAEIVTGHAEAAIKHLLEVMRLSPRDPLRFSMYNQLSLANFLSARYAEGLAYAELGIEDAPGMPQLHVALAMNAVGLGDMKGARRAFEEARQRGQAYTERVLAGGLVLRNQDQLNRATSFLRKARDWREDESRLIG